MSSNLMGDRLRAPSPARVEPSHVVRAGEGKEEDEEGGDQLAFVGCKPTYLLLCVVCHELLAAAVAAVCCRCPPDHVPSPPHLSPHPRQPLRSHYCRVCERRVATYDHHCFVIGTCIGEKNHCRFWWFLFFQSISLCLAITSVGCPSPADLKLGLPAIASHECTDY